MPWIEQAGRTLFLTGTPLENRVEEFRNLVSYLRPDLLDSVSGAKAIAGPIAFRKAVAPVYLRRNQTDVLTELPERLEMEDWIELSGPDFETYKDAVASGNFMAMRRAAYMAPESGAAAKLTRLRDIVEESAANDWKVVISPDFLDVLRAVEGALDNRVVVGQITGRVPADARQELVDRFTDIEGHAVLLGQIQAGGTGLNIQAASVVVLPSPSGSQPSRSRPSRDVTGWGRYGVCTYTGCSPRTASMSGCSRSSARRRACSTSTCA